MRVLFTIFDSDLGGRQRVALQVMEGLRSRGAELYAAVRGTGPLITAVEALGVKTEHVPTRRVRDPRGYLALARVVARIRPDLIYDNGAAFIAAVVGKFRGIPVVIHEHSILGFVGSRLRQGLERTMMRWEYSWASAVIAVSDAAYRAIIDLGVPAGRVKLIRNGVPIDKFAAKSPRARALVRSQLGLQDDSVVISLVARLCELKGQRLLMEAARRLPWGKLKLHFLFVGRDEERGGAYEAYLKRLAGELGLADCVTFTGHRDDIPGILGASDMTILPSNTEACGLSILESMAASKPVIATATAGAREIIEDGITGLIVPIGNPTALANAILRLVEDPNLRATLAANAYAHVTANYSEEVFLQNVMSVLSHAVPQCATLEAGAIPEKP